MNNNNDELERMLGQQLHRQVDSMNDHPLGFGDVKGRAGRIQRNRRLAAGAAVAAAVAIITPVAMLASQGPVADGDKVDPAIPAPREMVSTTLTLDGLSRGDAPGVEYFTPDGVVLPGEGLQELDPSYQAMVRDGTGWLALGPARDEVLQLDEDFAPDGETWGSTHLGASPDHSWVTWSDGNAERSILFARSTADPEDGMTWEFPAASTFDPAGFLAPNRVAYQIQTLDKGRENIIAEPDGSITRIGDFVSLTDANPATGLLSVDTRAKDNTVCSGVVDPDVSTTEPVWETCDHRLGAFSPDGRYVMASSPYGDGFGLTEIAVLDTETGDPVASFTQARNTQIALVHPVWESADTIIAVGSEGETQTMVRLGVDGTLEETVDPVEAFYGDLYFYLGADRTTL